MHDRAYLPPQTRGYVRKLVALALACGGARLTEVARAIPEDDWQALIDEGYIRPGGIIASKEARGALKAAIEAIK